MIELECYENNFKEIKEQAAWRDGIDVDLGLNENASRLVFINAIYSSFTPFMENYCRWLNAGCDTCWECDACDDALNSEAEMYSILNELFPKKDFSDSDFESIVSLVYKFSEEISSN